MSDRIAGTVMVPSYQYDELQKISHDNWVGWNKAERRASAYKKLLEEARQALPARGSLRRRIAQALEKHK